MAFPRRLIREGVRQFIVSEVKFHLVLIDALLNTLLILVTIWFITNNLFGNIMYAALYYAFAILTTYADILNTPYTRYIGYAASVALLLVVGVFVFYKFPVLGGVLIILAAFVAFMIVREELRGKGRGWSN